MKLAFLVSKGLSCLDDKQNNAWLLVDMEFLFSFFNSTSHSFASLTTRAYVLFTISFFCRIFIDILILFFFFLHNFSFVFVILIDSFGFII